MLLLDLLGGESANTCGEIYIGDLKPYREWTTRRVQRHPDSNVHPIEALQKRARLETQAASRKEATLSRLRCAFEWRLL